MKQEMLLDQTGQGALLQMLLSYPRAAVLTPETWMVSSCRAKTCSSWYADCRLPLSTRNNGDSNQLHKERTNVPPRSSSSRSLYAQMTERTSARGTASHIQQTQHEIMWRPDQKRRARAPQLRPREQATVRGEDTDHLRGCQCLETRSGEGEQ